MPTYHAPTRDTLFVLNELLDIDQYADVPGFAAVSTDLAEAVVSEAGRFASEVVAPINQTGDAHGCIWHADGSVTTPPGYQEAFARYRDGGWTTLVAPEAYGGQALPHVFGTILEEYLNGASMGFAMYPGLNEGAIAALLAVASEAQKALYLPPMVAGRWLGTMNLTEPHAGTDLGLLRTRAQALADGSYAITGTKIFISSGEHDLADNIIHLVLARTSDAPAGTKGISLFLVPKFLPEADGQPGRRNALSAGAVEHKMGIRGNATCVMNYDGATGFLLGEECKGLSAMFVMMNAARLSVGVQGLAVAEAAYQNGATYALERRQGRAPTGPAEAAAPADPLIVQPDVRRMLMDARASIEALRALAYWAAIQVDLAHHAPDATAREMAEDLVGLLTPVIKGHGSDCGYRIATDMQQIWGGHGYITENGMDQFVRDARIAMIYEGANGVQAMDLVGRKITANGGRALHRFVAMVRELCAQPDDATEQLAQALSRALDDLEAATTALMQAGAQDRAAFGAGSYAYMTLLGAVALGWMWLRTARVAQAALAAGTANRRFYEAKVKLAHHFMARRLPETGYLRAVVEAGPQTLMAMDAADFALTA
jgi:alkylation response protein AidB-like acyl-CoA dehydrogenase